MCKSLNNIDKIFKEIAQHINIINKNGHKVENELEKAAEIFNEIINLEMQKDLNQLEEDFLFIRERKESLREDLKTIMLCIDRIIGSNGILQQVENWIADNYISKIKSSPGVTFKTQIRKIANREFMKAVNIRFRLIREKQIVDEIKRKSLSWETTLDREHNYGSGLDERIIEFPLALQVGDFESPGRVLDAGAALNVNYIREYIGHPMAFITHFTQSGKNEECRFSGYRVSYVFGDLRSMDFKDATFDRVLCISTIEHIGMDNSRYGGPTEELPMTFLDALSEMMRVLIPEGQLLLTFPYGIAKNCGWYQIFDEVGVQLMIKQCQPCKYQIKYFYYDGIWYEGLSSSPRLENNVEYITGLCALLITKNP